MKFSHSALTVLFLTGHASAWTTTARIVPRRAFAAVQLHSVATETAGEAATESFRLKFKDGEKAMSPWHDIDLKNDDGSYNMVGPPFSKMACWRLFVRHSPHRFFHLVFLTSPFLLWFAWVGCRNPENDQGQDGSRH